MTIVCRQNDIVWNTINAELSTKWIATKYVTEYVDAGVAFITSLLPSNEYLEVRGFGSSAGDGIYKRFHASVYILNVADKEYQLRYEPTGKSLYVDSTAKMYIGWYLVCNNTRIAHMASDSKSNTNLIALHDCNWEIYIYRAGIKISIKQYNRKLTEKE